MTVRRRDGRDTPFSAWVRDHPELESKGNKLSITDSDLWCHRYSLREEADRENATDIRDAVDNIMLVEIKTFSADQSYAQRDTLTVVDHLLRMACSAKDGKRRPVKIFDGRLENRRMRSVRCFGVHLLQLSGDRPDTSSTMLWDKRSFILEEHLIELLRFERDPDHPKIFLDTRRHQVVSRNPMQLKLIAGDSASS
jgi:hypothetical protein